MVNQQPSHFSSWRRCHYQCVVCCTTHFDIVRLKRAESRVACMELISQASAGIFNVVLMLVYCQEKTIFCRILSLIFFLKNFNIFFNCQVTCLYCISLQSYKGSFTDAFCGVRRSFKLSEFGHFRVIWTSSLSILTFIRNNVWSFKKLTETWSVWYFSFSCKPRIKANLKPIIQDQYSTLHCSNRS